MSDPLYRKELLRLAADAHGAGKLTNPSATGHAHNPTCGDKVTVDLILKDGRVVSVAQETKACVLTQASASILGRNLRGAARADVESLRETVRAMVRAGGKAPGAPFEAFHIFDADYRNRERCILLPLDAVLAAFEASETAKAEGKGPEE